MEIDLKRAFAGPQRKMDKRFVLLFLLVVCVHRAVTVETNNQKQDNRVVGGRPALPNEFPYQVAFRSRGSSGSFCGGSIVADRWILTAAHCFYTDDTLDSELGDYEIVAGTTDLRKSRKVWKIDKLILRGYEPESSQNDIALVKTQTSMLHAKRPVHVQRSIHGRTRAMLSGRLKVYINSSEMGRQRLHQPSLKAIKMAKSGLVLQDWTKATISGFGKMHENGVESPHLLATEVDVLPDLNCAKAYQEYRADMMLCGGGVEGGRDTCQGDSGGPLVVSFRSKPLLAGITSFGEGCARKGFPGVYSRVSYFYAWIVQQMKAN